MTKPNATARAFRVGRVAAYLRGHVWYLRYSDRGQRIQRKVGPDLKQARQLAAQINGQLESGAPSMLGFQPITIAELRERWLAHHEHVRRSSLQTIHRYRTATEHLLDFTSGTRPLSKAAEFGSREAEEFVRYLRNKRVAPNGHARARQRPLRDAGVKYILETCCSLFNYAAKHRHLPPYAENPFLVIEVRRLPIEDARPVIAFTDEQSQRFLAACDDWQFPVFLTLMLTGLRPGELVHLLLPADLDLESGWLRIRNKPQLGWQVKTRNERDIPLVPVLLDVLQKLVGKRSAGPLFLQRRAVCEGYGPPLAGHSTSELQQEVLRRVVQEEGRGLVDRAARQQVATSVWRDLGALKEDWVRVEFKRVTKRMGLAEITAPKTLRHTFATVLQDANVDPLVRNELMGHAPAYGSALGMTAVYTHTRPETKRRQLEAAFAGRAATVYAEQRNPTA